MKTFIKVSIDYHIVLVLTNGLTDPEKLDRSPALCYRFSKQKYHDKQLEITDSYLIVSEMLISITSINLKTILKKCVQ